jgi:hypothetical protein
MAERWSPIRTAQELEKEVDRAGELTVATEPRQNAVHKWVVTPTDLLGVHVVTWVDRFATHGTLYVAPRPSG